jgi:hypothetical protein
LRSVGSIAEKPLGPDYPLLDAGPELKPPDAVRDALWAWIQAGTKGEAADNLQVMNVGFDEDGNMQPFRLTLTVACEVEAPSEWDARTDALSWFRERELPAPETVVANAAE